MLYPLPDIAAIALIMTCGAVIQGAVGFASGLICVPLLVVFGLSIPEAATINLLASGMQNITGATKLRSNLELHELVIPVSIRFLAIPLGTYAAWLADGNLSMHQSKQLMGIILLVTIIFLRVTRFEPRETISVLWQLIAFSTSGFLMGFASIGGAPMVVYVNSLTWTAAKSRAFLFFCSAVALPIAATSFWWKHGAKILPAAVTTLLILPVVFGGLWLGLHLGHHLSKRLFRRITYSLLTVIAVGAIIAPMLTDE